MMTAKEACAHSKLNILQKSKKEVWERLEIAIKNGANSCIGVLLNKELRTELRNLGYKVFAINTKELLTNDEDYISCIVVWNFKYWDEEANKIYEDIKSVLQNHEECFIYNTNPFSKIIMYRLGILHALDITEGEKEHIYYITYRE